MKKKSMLTMVVSLALVGVVAVGSTLAYLTSTASTVNTFTVGDVGITQTETGNWESTPLVPGVAVTKQPVVTVAANSEASYVYAKIVYGSGLEALVDLDINPAWTSLGNGVYQYTGSKANATTHKIAKASAPTDLEALFTTVTAKTTDTHDQLHAAGLDTKIRVASFAIQAEGITATDLTAQLTSWSNSVVTIS